MLRGVNKQIIEVKDTGSRYFEKALLFVRPEFAELGPGQLEQEANRYLATVGRPPVVQLHPRDPARKKTTGVSYAARMARIRRRKQMLGIVLFGAGLLLFGLIWWFLL